MAAFGLRRDPKYEKTCACVECKDNGHVLRPVPTGHGSETVMKSRICRDCTLGQEILEAGRRKRDERESSTKIRRTRVAMGQIGDPDPEIQTTRSLFGDEG